MRKPRIVNGQDVIGLLLVYMIIAVSLAVALAMERRGSGGDVRKVVHIGVGFFVGGCSPRTG